MREARLLMHLGGAFVRCGKLQVELGERQYAFQVGTTSVGLTRLLDCCARPIHPPLEAVCGPGDTLCGGILLTRLSYG